MMPNVATSVVASVPAPAAADDRECMKASELATFLGVNKKTVYAYALRGLIPHRRLGRRIVFSRSQVVAWLGACKAAPFRKGI
jgi:excisionase family DNA binding protein